MNLASRPIRQPFALGGVFFLGIAISLSLCFAIRKLEKQNAQTTFDRLAQERFDRLEGSIALNLNDIASLGSYFDVQHTITRQDFLRLTAPLLADNNAIQALEWAPDVPHQLRHSMEEAAHRDGLASFRFTERFADGRMASAAPRRDYAPVYFVEPLRVTKKALGFDLLSSEARRKTIRELNRQRQAQSDQPNHSRAGNCRSIRSAYFSPGLQGGRKAFERARAAPVYTWIRARSNKSRRHR